MENNIETQLAEIVVKSINEAVAPLKSEIDELKKSNQNTNLVNPVSQVIAKEASMQTSQRIEVKEKSIPRGHEYAVMVLAKAQQIIDGGDFHDNLINLALEGVESAKSAITLLINDKTSDENSRARNKSAFENRLNYRNKSLGLSSITTGSGFIDPTTDPAFAGWLQEQSIFTGLAGVKRRNFINGAVKFNKGQNPGVGFWLGNTTQIGNVGITFEMGEVTMKKAGGLIYLDNDMLRLDIRQALQVISTQLQRVMANTVDAGFLNGSGSGNEPTGLFNISGIESVGATATPDTVKIAKDLRKAVRWMGTNNVNPTAPVWLLNRGTYNDLANQYDANSNYSVFSRTLIENNTIYGYPAVQSNFVPPTKLMLVDASRIVIGEGYGLQVESFDQTKAETDQTTIRAITATNIGLEFEKAAYIITGVNTWNV